MDFSLCGGWEGGVSVPNLHVGQGSAVSETYLDPGNNVGHSHQNIRESNKTDNEMFLMSQRKYAL